MSLPRSALAAAVLFACAPVPSANDPEAPPPDAYPHGLPRGGGFEPNPNFHPLPPGDFAESRFALRTEGEVVVIEGDQRFVSTDGMGHFGITDTNQVAIVQEVLATYPDVFDTIQIYLSFNDDANAGTAYYAPIANSIAGLGIDSFDNRGDYGLGPDGRLSGFSNMNAADLFGSFAEAGMPHSSFHAVIAQELTHRWLFHFLFRDATGMTNRSLLGRQDAHWSRLAQAFGSVQDGILYRDNSDGTFTALAQMNGFAPLDLYGLGIYRADQVGPFFYLSEATLAGMPLMPASPIPPGARVTGNRINVKMDQILAALGPRNPPAGTETPYYRVALVLVTQPGQPAAEWRPYLDAVKAVQTSFPETYRDWTFRAGAICTQVTARCPEPLIGLDKIRVEDGGDNLPAPGERVRLDLAVRNDGLGTAENVQVRLVSRDARATISTATVSAPPIAEGGAVDLPMPFDVSIGADVPCGTPVGFRMIASTQEGPRFSADFDLPVGITTLRYDPLEEAPNWTVDPDRDDTATEGRWELGPPEFISVLGVVTQPAADHTPGAAELAFVTGARRGETFSQHDVDGGKTTLESPLFAVGGARDPTLTFYAWFLAKNFAAQGGPAPVPGAALTVLGSNDGGATWKELLAIADDTGDWKRFDIHLRDFLTPSNRMRFRFVAQDPTPMGTVEAAIDDLSITDLLDSCPVPGAPDGGVGVPPGPDETGCGCSAGGRGGAIELFALGALLLAGRRRRR